MTAAVRLHPATPLEVLMAIEDGDPIVILGKRYVCDEREFTEAEVRAMWGALRKLDRLRGIR